jgi:hypothetical protein
MRRGSSSERAGARRRRGTGLVVGEGRGSSSERDGAATAATAAAAAAARRRRFEFLLGYRRELDSEGIFGLLLGAKKKNKKSEGWDSNPAPLDVSTCQLTSGAIGEILSAYHPLSFT